MLRVGQLQLSRCKAAGQPLGLTCARSLSSPSHSFLAFSRFLVAWVNSFLRVRITPSS